MNNPTSPTTLTTQLSTLADTLKQTNSLITRLAKLSFQPGSEPLATDSNNNNPNTVRLELAQDIHDALAQLEEDLELLSTEADDLNTPAPVSARRQSTDREREKARLSAQVTRLGEDLRRSRQHFRKAQLTAKRAAETAKQTERQLVFASLNQPPPEPTSNGSSSGRNTPDLFSARRRGPNQNQSQKQLSKQDLELDASQTVTSALRRTHALLTTELSRSRFAQETFDQSTQALADLGEKYSDLDSVLAASRNLLGTLLRSQKSDTWYLETAFYILLATLGWLVFRRLLWGPFFLLPRFFFNWFLWPPISVLLSITGLLGGSAAGTAAVSSARQGISGTTRPPLIVQPSAKRGSQPKFPEGMSGAHVPAGSGGQGAKRGKEGLEGRMSENIGQMAEESRGKAEGRVGEEDDGKVRRADGTVLKEREEPANPKKKMFEADVEDAREAERRRQDENAGGSRRKRDEL
ncbi:Protein transport protein sec20 [Saxophila tyrrhenica]|uniref:Protein transport protein sec20 n=1 Tax=Saxophila tyrrhenica TaxID=1690608 RepID=A0AAV9PIR7_9PEZI|nr:Protein transport protein sec20 [Saxophila tyrrhenica]